MALSMIESLFSQASYTSQEEIDRICQGVLENLYAPDKTNECMNQLRQLYFILQASHTEPCLPRNMISTLVNMVSSMDHDKTKECLLCEQILAELLPREQEDLGSDFYPSSNYQNATSSANCFPLYLMQGNKKFCLADVIPHAVRWMSSGKEDFNVQRQAFCFLVSLQVLHNRLVNEETMKTLNSTASDWLMNASLYQLPNPYTINPFKKDQAPVVNEVDGTPSRNFFTVLNIGQYYTNDQFLNIYSFSMLYKWLYHSQTSTEEASDMASKSAHVFKSLVDKSIDYCFRILDQCERKPKVPSDIDLQNCCLLEVVNVLDMICKIEPGHVARVFQEVRRLYQRLMHEPDKPRLLIPVLQFFLNHGKSVEHDPQEAYTLFFHKLLTQCYLDPAFSFDTITFIKDNLETLCHNTNILSTYFPNILKMLAWNPRSYLADFEEILPALMSPNTAIEVFHMLLDLPCVTVALEITERCKKSEVQTLSTEAEPTSSLSAFQSALYRPMFNFFTRVEGGHGDTINRLSLFHNILGDMNQHPRVLVCSQVVPVLLRIWFDVVLDDASSDFLSHLIPVLLERTAFLYNIPGYQGDVRKVLAENVVHLLKKYPEILYDQASEIKDFLISPRNISGREEFFANLVWCVGELCSVRHDNRCTAETITRFFDTLEVLTYELSGMSSANLKEEISNPSKIICMLMSSISKGNKKFCLADVIPHAVRWMSSGKEDFNVQRQAFCFLVSLQVLHNRLVNEETMKTLNSTASDWLMNASLYQLPNPYTINPFKKDQAPVVNEVDGTPSRNFFTVLNIGQYYTNDQFLNIYSFSMLYKWLYHSQTSTEEASDMASKSAHVFKSLVDKSIDYCFRILDQCERKPKVPSDIDLQNCCLLEVVNVLDMICKIEPGHVARVFQEVRRLYQRLMHEPDKPRLLIPVLQFFLNHGKSVEHDPQEAYTLFFHKLLTQCYLDPAFSFDTITFIKDNLETLCHNTNILSTYFPNILKMLAWNPRSYLADFEEILPALMSPNTAIEVFHMLLDLPCVTVALEITERCKKSEVQTLSTEAEPTSSLSAFQSALYRPMFNFFTRVEGGHGDTINRLSLFHNILGDMNQHPRVLVCSQVVPVLLRIWFDVVLDDASSDFLSHLIPVLLERTAFLYNIPGYQGDVRKVLAENVVHLLKKYPEILYDQASEIKDFLISPRNISGREEFFANLVWCVGELCSVRHDNRCTAETITRFFDTLEVLTYELSGMSSANLKEEISNPSKIICMLMSSISKLASKCQDLIPRSILLLTKVAKQQQISFLDTEIKDAVVGRAQELINLLKLPNFANVVLNPDDEIETGRWHRDNTSLPITLRCVQHILS